MTALELAGVSKRFGSTQALDDASLLVEQGTVHALLGENGAGKTTLVRVAFGLVQPDRGTIRIEGRELSLSGPADAIRHGVGMVHQHPTHVMAMTGLENLVLGDSGRFHRRAARAAAARLLERVGFSINLDLPVEALSVAAQQRLEILKAVSRDARILILDEPTAILAPEEAAELFRWLRRFAADGGTAVVITHKLEEARAHADALTVLRAGRTVVTRRAAEVSTEELTSAMIGESVRPSHGHPERSEGSAQPSDAILIADSITIRSAVGPDAIRNASLYIHRGEVLGVVGVEGSGHHELLLALSGRAPVASGSLTLPSRIGFVPEDRHRDAVVLPFTLTENLALAGVGARQGLIHWSEMTDRTRQVIERFDVRTTGPDATLAALSGGNQQKVVLGRELSGDPELLVLENPTRGLDIRATAFVHDQIRDARAAGRAVVVYSSDLDEAIAVADRIVAVHAGDVREVSRDRAAAGAAMLGASK